MPWSNSLPPEIQVLPDGTTTFSGPVVIQEANGSTAGSIGIDGSINGRQLNVTSASLNGMDLQTTLNEIPKGLVAEAKLSNGGYLFAISNTTQALIAITNGFSVTTDRSYDFDLTSMGVFSNTAGDTWEYQLVIYTSYPTAANYLSYTQVAGNKVVIASGGADNQFPALHSPNFVFSANHANVWLGLMINRVAGTGAIQPNTTWGPIWITAKDSGQAVKFSNGVYNPIPYGGGTPPAQPAQNYSQSFSLTWGASYDAKGIQLAQPDLVPAPPVPLWQGNNQTSAFNVDYATLQSILNGATNITATLFAYCEYTYYSSGANIELYTQNNLTNRAPSTWSQVLSVVDTNKSSHAPNPGWVSWDITDIITNIGTTFTGFAFALITTDLSRDCYSQNPYIQLGWTK